MINNDVRKINRKDRILCTLETTVLSTVTLYFIVNYSVMNYFSYICHIAQVIFIVEN